jgi:hypothetical protein
MRLLIICPTRQRPELAKRMLDSFYETRSSAHTRIMFYISEDDPEIENYLAGKEIKEILEFYIVGARRTIIEVFNYISFFRHADYYGEINDDHIYRTKGWDKILIEKIEHDGKGWGIAHGNDLINGSALPGAIVISGNIVRTLGYMALPALHHLYVDNYFKTIGAGINRLFYCPEVIIEHCHWAVGKAIKDDTYNAKYQWETTDKEAFEKWATSHESIDAINLLLDKIKKEE